MSAYPLQGSVVDTLATRGADDGLPCRSHVRRQLKPAAFHGSNRLALLASYSARGVLPPLPTLRALSFALRSAARTSGGRSLLTSPQRRRWSSPKHAISSYSRMSQCSATASGFQPQPLRRLNARRSRASHQLSSCSVGEHRDDDPRPSARPAGLHAQLAGNRGPEAQEHVHDHLAVISYGIDRRRLGSASARTPRGLAALPGPAAASALSCRCRGAWRGRLRVHALWLGPVRGRRWLETLAPSEARRYGYA